MKTYYEILEINPDASPDQIKEQYLYLANVWHPDKHRKSSDKEKAEARIKEINEAYATLRDEQKRAQYDERLQKQLGILTYSGNQPSQSAVFSHEELTYVMDIANNELRNLIKNLLNGRVRKSYSRYLRDCLLETLRTLSFLDESRYSVWENRVLSEIDLMLASNPELHFFIKKLEVRNPPDEEYDWVGAISRVVISRRRQLGLPDTATFDPLSVRDKDAQEEPRVTWTSKVHEDQPKSTWAKELEEMQDRIRRRRRGEDVSHE
jgi:curved DNA-binding protein CbpA